MNTRWQTALVWIAISLLVGVGWMALGKQGSPSGGSTPEGQYEPESPAPTARRDGPPSISREAGEEPNAGPRGANATEVNRGALRGRVVSDSLGTPLPGVRVTIARREHSEFRIPDAQERESRRPLATVLTDGDGRFEVPVRRAVPLDVEASKSKYATARRDHVFAGEDVELRLWTAAVLEGVLTRASDGSPVEGALVLGRDERRIEQCRARTSVGGYFLFEDVQPGLLTVEITPQDAVAPPSKRVELRAGVRTRLDLELESGVRIQGVVRDAQGRPVVGAEVGLGASFQRSQLTDVYGHYEMLGIGGARRRDLGDVRVRAEGHGQERRGLQGMDLTQDVRIDFVLGPARRATGRVIDTEGVPIEGAYVAGVGSKTVDGVARSDWESTRTDSAGRFGLASLHRLIDHQLFVKKTGFGTRVYDFPDDEGQRVQIDYGDLVLHRGGSLEGVLRTAAGSPLVDHLVKLRGANADFGRFRPDAEALKGTWVTAVRHSRTDSGGRFHFADLPGGELKLTASVLGRPGSKVEEVVRLAEGEAVEGLALTLDPGDPITGVVRTPDGLPAVGVFVQVAGEAGAPRIRARSGAGGRFELLGVTEGMGPVELFTIVASYNWYHPNSRLGVGRRVTARAGDSDVVLELRVLTSMTGTVERADGAIVAGVEVLAYLSGSPRQSASVLTRATTDAAGAFRLELPAGCRVDLVASQPSDEAPSGAVGSAPASTALEFVASDARGVVLRFGS